MLDNSVQSSSELCAPPLRLLIILSILSSHSVASDTHALHHCNIVSVLISFANSCSDFQVLPHDHFRVEM